MRRLQNTLLFGAILLGMLVVCPDSRAFTVRETDWGPFYYQTVYRDGTRHTTGLGPLIEHVEAPDGSTLDAFRPLLVRSEDPSVDRTRYEVLYPLASRRRLRNDTSWRFMLVYGWRLHDDPNKPYKLWVLPFYFQGRNRAGDDYGAIFPLGGTIRDILHRDYIAFFMWPLYTRSSVSGKEAHTVLWPFISWTERYNFHRYRVFPFYGETKLEGRYKKRFILWPIYTQADYYDPRNPGRAWILFPLAGRVDLSTQQSTMVLPPLIRVDRGDDMNRIHAPWPLVQLSEGEFDRRYFWPFHGWKRIGQTTTGFFLWPLCRYEHILRTREERVGYRFFPLVQHWNTYALNEDGTRGEVIRSKKKTWPLIAYRQDGDVNLTRVPALNPFRQWDQYERTWAPIFTVYSRAQRGEDIHHQILWGLYRHRRVADTYRRTSLFPLADHTRDRDACRLEWNLLKGLVGYRREGENRRLKLLYVLKIGTSTEETNP